MPPVSGKGVKGAATALAVSVRLEIVPVLAASATFTVRLKPLLALAPVLSVTVIVKFTAAEAADGVPVIAPVEVFRRRFAGSDGATAYV